MLNKSWKVVYASVWQLMNTKRQDTHQQQNVPRLWVRTDERSSPGFKLVTHTQTTLRLMCHSTGAAGELFSLMKRALHPVLVGLANDKFRRALNIIIASSARSLAGDCLTTSIRIAVKKWERSGNNWREVENRISAMSGLYFSRWYRHGFGCGKYWLNFFLSYACAFR